MSTPVAAPPPVAVSGPTASKWIWLAVAIVVGLVLAFSPTPQGLTRMGQLVLAITAGTVILWATEVMNNGVASVLIFPGSSSTLKASALLSGAIDCNGRIGCARALTVIGLASLSWIMARTRTFSRRKAELEAAGKIASDAHGNSRRTANPGGNGSSPLLLTE